MALTIVRHPINHNGKQSVGNIAFKTSYSEKLDCLFSKVYHCDNDLKPLSQSQIFEIKDNEESYHKKLRLEASKYNHLVTSHCTNPEWNPENYSRNLEQFLKDESGEQ